MALLRSFSSIIRNISVQPGILARTFTTTSIHRVKEITEVTQNDTLTIQSMIKPAPREHMLIKEITECKNMGTQFCPVCTLGLDIKHTDVLILSQYVRSDGCMLPRRITGLCKKQQKRIGTLVRMAHKSGLMPNLGPRNSKNDPKRRFGWKKFNKYFDENTIRLK